MVKGNRPPISLAGRTGLGIVFLVCALAVFLLGANYYKMFPTNGNSLYAASLAIIFLVAALLCKRSARFQSYWQIAYAFFVGSMVNLVSDLFAITTARSCSGWVWAGARTRKWQLGSCMMVCWW